MTRSGRTPNSSPRTAGAPRARTHPAAAPAAEVPRPNHPFLTPLGTALSDALLYCDEAGRVGYVNEEACRMLGMTAVWARGKAGVEVLRTAVPGEDLLAEAESGPTGARETLLVTRGGVEVPARITLGRTPEGGAFAVVRDLTQAQRLQRELRLRERLASVGELAAGVAHEIRNPLAGISSSAQVLMTRFEPRDDRQKFCRVIIEQVDRLDGIITSLLKFARPPEPRLRLSRLEDVVRKVVELEAERLSEARIAVETRFTARMPGLYFDPGLIEQVLLNLVVNAAQAMPSGGTLTIEVGTGTRRERPLPRTPGRREEDHVGGNDRAAGSFAVPTRRVARLRVIDTGVGIPRQMVPRLFDPFFTTKAAGTGLGLSISQSILQEHGGVISIASREGRGTTVVVELPLEKRHGQRRQDAQ